MTPFAQCGIILFVRNFGGVCSQFWLSVRNSVWGSFNRNSRGHPSLCWLGGGGGAMGTKLWTNILWTNGRFLAKSVALWIFWYRNPAICEFIPRFLGDFSVEPWSLLPCFLDFLAFSCVPCFSGRVTPKILGKESKNAPKTAKGKSKEIQKQQGNGDQGTC